MSIFIKFTVNPLPNIPVTLSADTITYNSFTARWAAVSGATAYEISINNAAPVNVGSSLSYAASITGTGHIFKVRAIKGTATGDYSTAFNVPAYPDVPGNLSVDTISSTGFTARWAAVGGATAYEIQVNNNLLLHPL